MSECTECGMACEIGEFHPYIACLAFTQCHDGGVVRANLKALMDDSEAVRILTAKVRELEADYARWKRGRIELLLTMKQRAEAAEAKVARVDAEIKKARDNQAGLVAGGLEYVLDKLQAALNDDVPNP